MDLNLTDESEPESELCETRKKCFRLPSIAKTNIDIEELKSYLRDNIDELLGLPFDKDTFKNDDDASDHLTVYEEEADIIQSLLCDYQPNLKSFNIFFTDKLLYTSAETIRRFLEFKGKNIQLSETSPRRLHIRSEVRENIIVSAAKMKESFARKKRVKVQLFQVGDNVAVKVPKNDRSKVAMRRIQAVVVKLKNTSPPMYKLACQYGTIAGYFSTSELIPFPGKVQIENEDKEITLREAARQHSASKEMTIFCKCKTFCESKRCPCRRNDRICYTRCHSGNGCKNMQDYIEYLPSFGGFINLNGVPIYLSNTCPVDNWLAVFSMINQFQKPLYEAMVEHSTESNTEFSALMILIGQNEFNKAKVELAKMCEIPFIQRTYDFLGDESSRFTKFLKCFLQYEMTSTCSSEYCQSKEIHQSECPIPSISNSDGVSSSAFKGTVVNWLTGAFDSTCLRPLQEPLPAEEFIHWEWNNLTYVYLFIYLNEINFRAD